MENTDLCEIRPISRNETKPLLLDVHYARRIPSISFAYGLFRNGKLEGCVTFGTPPSAPLRSGLCGFEFAENVLELNRLCFYKNQKNDASRLIGAALRLLGGNRVVISFADTAHGHVGKVYQASNFLYCGLSAKRTDWKVRGKEHLHGQTIADEFRGFKNRAAKMREKYGDDFYLKDRSLKHRYVYIIGTKKFKKSAILALRYKVESYPVGQSMSSLKLKNKG